MQRLHGTVTDGLRAIPSAQVAIYTAGTTTLADIFDANGAKASAVPILNPITCDSLGRWICAVADGQYDIVIKPGNAPEYKIPYYQARDYDSPGTSAAAYIVGTSDTIQSRVRGWSTQNQNIWQVEAFDGTVLASVDNNGELYCRSAYVDGSQYISDSLSINIGPLTVGGVIIAGTGATLPHMGQTEVDFGSTGDTYGIFSVADAFAFVGAKITAGIAYDAPTGRELDEVEMEEINCVAGNVTVAGTFSLLVRSMNGSRLHGKFKVNYVIA